MGKAGRLSNSGYVKLKDVPDLVFQMTGVHRCHKSVYGWVLYGRADTHGDKIKLRAVKRLGAWYTRKEWLSEFIEKVG